MNSACIVCRERSQVLVGVVLIATECELNLVRNEVGEPIHKEVLCLMMFVV